MSEVMFRWAGADRSGLGVIDAGALTRCLHRKEPGKLDERI